MAIEETSNAPRASVCASPETKNQDTITVFMAAPVLSEGNMLHLMDVASGPARIDDVLALLRALGVQQLDYSLSGGGDSGEASIASIIWQDQRDDLQLPKIPVAIGRACTAITLNAFLEEFASNVPEGDWVNNEGGYGTVTFLPFEDGGTFYDDMTYRADGDYGDEDDNDWSDDIDVCTTTDDEGEKLPNPGAVINFGEVLS